MKSYVVRYQFHITRFNGVIANDPKFLITTSVDVEEDTQVRTVNGWDSNPIPSSDGVRLLHFIRAESGNVETKQRPPNQVKSRVVVDSKEENIR